MSPESNGETPSALAAGPAIVATGPGLAVGLVAGAIPAPPWEREATRDPWRIGDGQ